MKKEDYRRYGLEVPFYQSSAFYLFIFVAILVIDAVMLFNSIDLCFNNNSSVMSYIVTTSVCLVIDIMPLIIVDALHITATGKKILPWCAMGVIFAVIAVLLYQRIISSDTMFATSLIDGSDIEGMIKFSRQAEADGAEPYQKVMNLTIGVIPIASTLFGIVFTIRRNIFRRKINLVKNKITLENMMSAKEELEKSDDLYNILEEDEQLFENMKERINSLYKQMISDKNDLLALHLGNPESISYISELEYDDLFFDSVSQKQPIQVSVSMPLTQISY